MSIFLTWCIWEGGFDGFVTGIVLLFIGGAAMEFFSAKKAQVDQEKALEESAKAAAYREWELMHWESMRNETWRKLHEENQPEVIHIVEIQSEPIPRKSKKHNNLKPKRADVKSDVNSDVIDV